MNTVAVASDDERRAIEKLEATNAGAGLSSGEAAARLAALGPNRLVEERRITFLAILWEEVREPMILLLFVVAIFYSIWGQLQDTITIVVVIALLILAEVLNEFRAKRAIAALRKLSSPEAPVIRDGEFRQIPTADLVPGDLLLLRVGERIGADARLIDSAGLEVDESTLTGESFPVRKDERAKVPEDAPLGDRVASVFAGTVVTRGKGRAVVTATGMDTELGHIAGLTRAVKEPKTRLQLAMKQLAGWLVWVAVGFSVVIPAIGIAQGKPTKTMILTGLGLAFATIPEELPIVITMVLGLGSLQLSRHNALVKRLRAAETLGGVTVIATDKTGTLTENRMTLKHLLTASGSQDFAGKPVTPVARKMLEIGVLVNDVEATDEGGGQSLVGDPMEVALIEGAEGAGVTAAGIRSRFKITDDFEFDTRRKVMSVVVDSDSRRQVMLKGAPEPVIDRSVEILEDDGPRRLEPAERETIMSEIDAMAAEGLRVVAFASKDLAPGLHPYRDEAETGLTFVGAAGFFDPPRSDVPEAVRACNTAGIRVMMITGDHASTAAAVAREIGLAFDDGVVTGAELDAMDDETLRETVDTRSVFARATPEHKLRIVRALRENGMTVAVTGDGVNDAPALREADIGVAMGATGTDVAREAADMILTDDNFSTIAYAVGQGRKLFDNLSKGVRFYLAVKVALVLIFIVPTILSLPFPFAPIQIVILELFMDLAASASFVAEPAEKRIMSRPPRDPAARFMDKPMLETIAAGAISLFAAVTTVYLLAYYIVGGPKTAGSAAFATWMIGTVALAYNTRSREPLASIGFLTNKVMVAWSVASIGFLVLAINTPGLQDAFKLTAISGALWGLAIGAALLFTSWLELLKLVTARS